MVGRHSLFKRSVAEQFLLLKVFAAYITKTLTTFFRSLVPRKFQQPVRAVEGSSVRRMPSALAISVTVAPEARCLRSGETRLKFARGLDSVWSGRLFTGANRPGETGVCGVSVMPFSKGASSCPSTELVGDQRDDAIFCRIAATVMSAVWATSLRPSVTVWFSGSRFTPLIDNSLTARL